MDTSRKPVTPSRKAFTPKGEVVDIASKPLPITDEKDAHGANIGVTVAEGYVTGYEVTDNEEASNIFELTGTDGSRQRFFSSKKIDDAFQDQGRLRDNVRNRYARIEYIGRVKLSGGKTFKDYRLSLWPNEVLKLDPLPF